MISLSVVILLFALIFAGLYFIYKMNRNGELHRTHGPRRRAGQKKGPP